MCINLKDPPVTWASQTGFAVGDTLYRYTEREGPRGSPLCTQDSISSQRKVGPERHSSPLAPPLPTTIIIGKEITIEITDSYTKYTIYYELAPLLARCLILALAAFDNLRTFGV